MSQWEIPLASTALGAFSLIVVLGTVILGVGESAESLWTFLQVFCAVLHLLGVSPGTPRRILLFLALLLMLRPGMIGVFKEDCKCGKCQIQRERIFRIQFTNAILENAQETLKHSYLDNNQPFENDN